MTIFVTGVAGFIGASTARVDALSRDFGDRFQFQRVDFCEPAALNALSSKSDFDRIIHLGAQAGVRYSLENPTAYLHSNLVGHGNMLELAGTGVPVTSSTPHPPQSTGATKRSLFGSRIASIIRFRSTRRPRSRTSS